MRTTINLPDELIARAKQLAARSRTTLTALIEASLRETLGRRRRSGTATPFEVVTYGTGGVLPGIDLDDSATLLDAMERPADPARR